MWLYKRTKYAGKQFGRYTIETPIGEGRYGLCFLAWSEYGRKGCYKEI